MEYLTPHTVLRVHPHCSKCQTYPFLRMSPCAYTATQACQPTHLSTDALGVRRAAVNTYDRKASVVAIKGRHRPHALPCAPLAPLGVCPLPGCGLLGTNGSSRPAAASDPELKLSQRGRVIGEGGRGGGGGRRASSGRGRGAGGSG